MAFIQTYLSCSSETEHDLHLDDPTDWSIDHKKKRVMTTFHKTAIQLVPRIKVSKSKSHHPSYWPLRSSAAWPQLLLEGPTRSAVEHGETIDLFCSWLGKSKGHRKNKLHGCTRLKYKQSSNVFFSRQQVFTSSLHFLTSCQQPVLHKTCESLKHFQPIQWHFFEKKKKRSRAVIRAFILHIIREGFYLELHLAGLDD